MKRFLVLFCVVVLCYGVSDKLKKSMSDKINEYSKSCLTTTKSTPADLAALLAKTAPVKKEAKCLLACIFKGFGIQDKNGNLTLQGIMTVWEPLKTDDPQMYQTMVKVIDSCSKEVINRPDECENASNYFKCKIKYAQQFGLDKSLI